jgi:hypothetical protein
MIFTSSKSNASNFTFFALYQYRSSQMPVAEATLTPTAHEELHSRGLERVSSPSHSHQLARRPGGTLAPALPFWRHPISQAFLSILWEISLKM